MKQHLQDELLHIDFLSLVGFHCGHYEEKIYTWKEGERVWAAGRVEKQELWESSSPAQQSAGMVQQDERGKAALLLF